MCLLIPTYLNPKSQKEIIEAILRKRCYGQTGGRTELNSQDPLAKLEIQREKPQLVRGFQPPTSLFKAPTP